MKKGQLSSYFNRVAIPGGITTYPDKFFPFYVCPTGILLNLIYFILCSTGILLNLAQFKVLRDHANDINDVIEQCQGNVK
jgi:hypothetical protein